MTARAAARGGRPRRTPALVAVVALVAAAGVVVAVTMPWSSSRAASVRVERSRLGHILVDGRGRTLYLFSEDRAGRSTCYSGCAKVWPPALASATPTAGSGVDASKLTTQPRGSSGRQLVYAGHPLYTLAGERPRELNGQGWMGAWFVVAPSGKPIGRPHGDADDY